MATLDEYQNPARKAVNDGTEDSQRTDISLFPHTSVATTKTRLGSSVKLNVDFLQQKSGRDRDAVVFKWSHALAVVSITAARRRRCCCCTVAYARRRHRLACFLSNCNVRNIYN